MGLASPHAAGLPASVPCISDSLSLSRFLIQILPAATVAPLFFQGKIEFGVINQSSSAFNHILSDVSLVVYQVLPSSASVTCTEGTMSLPCILLSAKAHAAAS